MKILDKYIFKKFMSAFIFVVIILVVIICVIDFTEKNDDFMKHSIPGSLIMRYYLTFIPYMASLLTPITAFIAAVFVTAKMAAQTEIIAILASGVSFKRIMLPYFIGSVMIAIASFYLNGYVIPDANKFRINFELAYLKKPYYYSGRNIHIKIGQNQYIYMDRFDNRRDRGYLVTLEVIENDRLLEKLNARTISWDTTTEKWTLGIWQRRIITETNEIITQGDKLDTLLNLSPRDFDNNERMWETLTLTELNARIELLASRGSEAVGIYEIEKYIRFMQPFTVFILVFLGLIVSSRKSRRGTGFQIALGFLIAFIFIIFFILARAIAEANSMDPVLAVWLPNISFTIIGLVMYNTVPR